MSNRRDDDYYDRRPRRDSDRRPSDRRSRDYDDDYYDDRRSSRSSGSRSSSSRSGSSSRRSDYDYDYDNRRRSGSSSRSSSRSGSRGRSKKKKSGIIILCVELAVLLVLGFVAYTLFIKMNVTKVGKVELDETEIQESISETVQSNESMKDYTNIALFGVDSREGQLNKNTRSDTIIIASINNETHDIKLVSVYRDTYLNLSNDTYSKANAAYAAGGPQQAISMLNMNLDMDIEDFVTIGFDGLIDVIDDLGGVEINVQENEISHLNNYQISMVGKKSGTNAAGEDNFVATEGVDYTPVTSSGLQTLNGLQATAYCRIRYVGNDFQRAQRQRDVLMAVLEKAKTKPSKLADIAADVFDETYTSLDLSEITELLSDIASYNVTGNDGFPYADYRKTGTLGKAGSCVVACDLTDNVQWLHEFLFDETDYECSSDVQTISDHIKSVASQYTLN